jgi:DNA-directed RNA polymerase subunit H
MHILQPKHTKLRQNEVKELLQKLNISITQLPKILKTDAALPQDIKSGDVIKIERKIEEGKAVYYRVVA